MSLKRIHTPPCLHASIPPIPPILSGPPAVRGPEKNPDEWPCTPWPVDTFPFCTCGAKVSATGAANVGASIRYRFVMRMEASISNNPTWYHNYEALLIEVVRDS